MICAKKRLATENTEKRKHAEELIVANEELDFQKDQKQQRTFELLRANNQLALEYHQNRDYTRITEYQKGPGRLQKKGMA